MSRRQTFGPGVYELLVTTDLAERIGDIGREIEVVLRKLETAEAPDRLALHLSRAIEHAVSSIPESKRVEVGVALARGVLASLSAHAPGAELQGEAPIDSGQVLRALRGRQIDGSYAGVQEPLTPLLDTTLLTNAPDEPRLVSQIHAEIDSADRIDLLVAFIRRSGLTGIQAALERHTARGRKLRVLTTTYTGSTERAALDRLEQIGAQIRVSYDTTSTRLHAKAWLFHRESGFSTAYIGSSNLTQQAQVSGLEWNVRISGARNPDVIGKIEAVFGSYWEGGDFLPYDAEEFDARTQAPGSGPAIYLSPVEIRPEPFQERLLEQIRVARELGRHRNLLVSATGTGKTVMAALDYAELRRTLPRARLLFVAHRKEILDKSQATFRHALRDPGFGESWVGGRRPNGFDHVFASIQSLSHADIDDLPPDHFDVVIVDEFHHSAAPSYRRLLDHIQPRELLGLTATPERADGESVLGWFGGRIAAELRLWDAIDQHYLSPFVYFGIYDGIDLAQVPWRRGRGYDVAGLSNVYTANDAWARRVVKELAERVPDLASMRALGFCVSVEHARYMARIFEQSGIRADAIWGDCPAEARESALRRLSQGDIQVLFSVDLFNEGIDLPAIDALLLVRPTESPTLFLQQLGRGLRRAPGKTICLVLDFVGNHRREFRFDRRLRALLGGTRKDLASQIEAGFPYLPAACHMELDAKASEIVLRSIRESIPSRWSQRVEELTHLSDSGRVPTLADYLEHSGLELEDLYTGNRAWSDLREAAGLATLEAGPVEVSLRRAIGRMLHLDDDTRLRAYAELLEQSSPPEIAAMSERNRRLLRMLIASLLSDRSSIAKGASLQDAIALVWKHPQVRAELRELLDLLQQRIDHVHEPLATHPDVPLQVHARYTRFEILAAFAVGDGARIPSWQTGVRWIPDARADLLAFTLNKTDGSFSPTTRYRDYAISRELIHWESQGVTRADSETGLRYQNHVAQGSTVLLFARLRQSDRAFWFLGPATYVQHEGECPMAVTWKLAYRLPGDLFARFAAAVA